MKKNGKLKIRKIRKLMSKKEIWEIIEKMKIRADEMESEEYEKKIEDKINKIIDKHEDKKV